MEQHPIPQNVSSYQFKLVGDMTLKQFFQLAGGFLVALLFYSIPLIGIIKWPIVILSALLGAAMAFVPLEERPLERWIFAFFRAIYSPTEFFWQKTVRPMKFYADEPQIAEAPAGPQQAALKDYLATANPKTGATNKLEGEERGFFAKLTGIVSGLVVQATGGPIEKDRLAQISAKGGFDVPKAVSIKIERASPAHLVVEEKSQGQAMTTNQVAPILAGEEIVSTKQAIFSVDAAPPNPPSTPNVVVGQVVDAGRRIVEGAIIEIRDASGRPIRALRSNKAGHFITVTPLDNGRYDILTDKEGYEFTPVSFDAGGTIIPPILVQGRKMLPEGVPMNPVVQSVSPSFN